MRAARETRWIQSDRIPKEKAHSSSSTFDASHRHAMGFIEAFFAILEEK
jgi:hypothetical protein